MSRVKSCRRTGEAREQCGLYYCNHQNQAEEGQGRKKEMILHELKNAPGTGWVGKVGLVVGKIYISREWKIGHYRGVTEGAKENNQDA